MSIDSTGTTRLGWKRNLLVNLSPRVPGLVGKNGGDVALQGKRLLGRICGMPTSEGGWSGEVEQNDNEITTNGAEGKGLDDFSFAFVCPLSLLNDGIMKTKRRRGEV